MLGPPFYESENCPLGDPLCIQIEKPEPAPPPKPKAAATTPKSSFVTVEQRNHDEKAVIQDRAQFTKVVHQKPPKERRPDLVEKQDEQGQWYYAFDADRVGGECLGLSISGRAKPWNEPQPMGCLEAILKLREMTDLDEPWESAQEKIRANYISTLTCLDSCVTTEQANFLADCVDWEKLKAKWGATDEGQISLDIFHETNPFECAKDKLEKAAKDGEFFAWSRDPKTGKCAPCTKPGWHWKASIKKCVVCAKDERWNPKTEACEKIPPPPPPLPPEASTPIGKKIQREIERTHRCPENFSDLAEIKRVAREAFQYGVPANPLPMGKTRSFSCGYNSSNMRWYRVTTRCIDPYTCYSQGNERNPANCQKFVRRSTSDPTFVAVKSCTGETSYRHGGAIGDLTFIPIADKVWIETYGTPRDGIFYYGLTFSE
jgi:hypothetical protein